MVENQVRIIIAAGGTGGHLYPGIALATELISLGYWIKFVVRKNDIGIPALEENELEFEELDVIGLPRKISFSIIIFFIKLITSIFSAYKIVREYSPDIIIGMGAYISFPVIMSGKLHGKKIVIQEQNYVPGLTNKILSNIVDKIAVSFPESEKYFKNDKHKVVYTGTPIRRMDIVDKYKARTELGLEREKPTLLVFGGSLGATKINHVIVQTIKESELLRNKLQVIHLTGDKDYETVKNMYEDFSDNVKVYAKYSEMYRLYSASDLVLSRAGGSTLAELIHFQKPVILIPYPSATNNHQYYNGQWLAKYGVAEYMLDNELTVEKIKAYLEKLVNDSEAYLGYINNYKTVKFPVGTQELIKIVKQLR